MIVLLVFILVVGFFTCHIHPIEKQKIYRFEGQYLYLTSARYGFSSAIIALLAYLTLSIIYPSIKQDLDGFIVYELGKLKLIHEDSANETLLCIYLGTLTPVVISITIFASYLKEILSTIFLNIREVPLGKPKMSTKEYILAKVLSDSPLDNILYQLYLERWTKNVMLSMTDRKVYVGRIISVGEPGDNKEISLMPVLSGYRNKDTLTVEFTTDYDWSSDEAELTLVIRQENIMSATEFDFDEYDRINNLSSTKNKTIEDTYLCRS